MPAGSLLALLDDIATVLDDVAVMTKTSATKTAGVLGDDLALNAQQVAGVRAERELPVVWAVAKGSFVNKCILVPGALVLSVAAPWLVTPLLMLGGAYLCFEGAEKLAHPLLASHAEEDAHAAEVKQAAADAEVDLAALERDKIKGAIRTDFVLSAEIIAISLGVVAAAPLPQRALVLGATAIAMTVGVYGFVAALVKLDDLGLHLVGRGGAWAIVGRGLLALAPRLMKLLSIAGTIAMFLVGGGILVHGLGPVHHAIEGLVRASGWAGKIVGPVCEGLVGVVAGALLVVVHTVVTRLRRPREA